MKSSRFQVTVCAPSTVALNLAWGADRARLGAGSTARTSTPRAPDAIHQRRVLLRGTTSLLTLASMTPRLLSKRDATVRPSAGLRLVVHPRSCRGLHRL